MNLDIHIRKSNHPDVPELHRSEDGRGLTMWVENFNKSLVITFPVPDDKHQIDFTDEQVAEIISIGTVSIVKEIQRVSLIVVGNTD